MEGDASFRGRRALVTGGSSGIGRAIALALARAGAHVAIVARREGPLHATAEALRAAAADPGQRIAAIAADVADEAQAARAVAQAASALGGLDLVVNNAGAARALRFEDTPLAEFRRLLEVNFLGAVYVTRAALPQLGAGACIANVSSLAGAIAIYGYAAYAPSKFALTAFSEVLRQELRPRGITVSVLLPPDTDTPQLAAENREKPPATRALAGNVPVLAPETVAAALLDGLARGRAVIVPGWRARATLWAARHLPGLARRIVDREIARAEGRNGAPARAPGASPTRPSSSDEPEAPSRLK
jgi:3-dehydrosphinganine reductase